MAWHGKAVVVGILALASLPLTGCTFVDGLMGSDSQDAPAQVQSANAADSDAGAGAGAAADDPGRPGQPGGPEAEAQADTASHPLAFTMTSLEGEPVDMDQYRGKVVLIVNTASHCGLTPQYADLQKLHEKYSDQGLAILGFPANNFGNQEPGNDQQIAQFCQQNYGVSFDMFSKISVKGSDQHPMYSLLTAGMGKDHLAGPVRWNFEKFLIDRQGNLVGRFAPSVRPGNKKVIRAIERELTPSMSRNSDS